MKYKGVIAVVDPDTKQVRFTESWDTPNPFLKWAFENHPYINYEIRCAILRGVQIGTA